MATRDIMMSDLTTYLIIQDGSVSPPYNHHEAIREGLALAKEHGVLVPDTRLQVIADTYNEWQDEIGSESVEAYNRLIDVLGALAQEDNE